MKLNNVIESLYVSNTCTEFCEVRIVRVNSMNQGQNELFYGTIKEMVTKWQDNETFGAGFAEDWYVVGYTVVDECLPIFTRPIEIRVI